MGLWFIIGCWGCCFGCCCCCCCCRTCCSSTGSTGGWCCSSTAWWLPGLFGPSKKAFPFPVPPDPFDEFGGKLGEMYPESWWRWLPFPLPFIPLLPVVPFIIPPPFPRFSASSEVRIFKDSKLLLFRPKGGCWLWWFTGWTCWDFDQCFDRNSEGSSKPLLTPFPSERVLKIHN